MGPLLFLMYFNDFPEYLGADVDCLLYADDATIMVRGATTGIVVERCNTVMRRVSEWCIANELCLNENKTVKMVLSLKKTDFLNPDSNRFLGVYISAPNLKFDDHARYVGAKISRNIFLLRTLKTTVSLEVAKTAFHALIQTHLNYSILAWGNGPSSNYLFGLQRRAVRVLGGLNYRDDCRQTFVSLAILTLPSMYVFQSIVYAYCNKSNFRNCSDNHEHNTRNKDNVYVQYCRLSTTQRGPNRMSQVLFNKLPLRMRSLPLIKLKTDLKLYLTSKAFYSVSEFLSHDFVIVPH